MESGTVGWNLWTMLTSDPLPNEGLYKFAYILQLSLSCTASLLNFLMAVIAFVGDSHFTPYQPIFRALVFMELITSGVYVHDAFKSLTHPMETGVEGFVSIRDCSENKSYAYLVIACRQWGAQVIMVMGLERYLFMRYPLWFKTIRLRKCPIIASTLIFTTISVSIAYVNALFVMPDDRAFLSCEATFAFGDYGWIHCFFTLVPIVTGLVLNKIATRYMRMDRILVMFGNNRTKLNSEKRKIRKAEPIIAASVACTLAPQLLILLARVASKDHLQLLKLLISQLFLLKCLANIVVLRVMTRRKRGALDSFKYWLEQRRKKVNPSDSIVSISYNVR